MISIIDEMNTPDVDVQQLENDAQRIVELMGYADDFDLSIVLTDNQKIQQFNRDFRHKDVPTDILSFPFHPDLKAGETIKTETEDDKNLGDLIISLEYIQPICKEENKTLNEYLKILLCHGICHLLGYDHYTEETDKVMKEKRSMAERSVGGKMIMNRKIFFLISLLTLSYAFFIVPGQNLTPAVLLYSESLVKNDDGTIDDDAPTRNESLTFLNDNGGVKLDAELSIFEPTEYNIACKSNNDSPYYIITIEQAQELLKTNKKSVLCCAQDILGSKYTIKFELNDNFKTLLELQTNNVKPYFHKRIKQQAVDFSEKENKWCVSYPLLTLWKETNAKGEEIEHAREDTDETELTQNNLDNLGRLTTHFKFNENNDQEVFFSLKKSANDSLKIVAMPMSKRTRDRVWPHLNQPEPQDKKESVQLPVTTTNTNPPDLTILKKMKDILTKENIKTENIPYGDITKFFERTPHQIKEMSREIAKEERDNQIKHGISNPFVDANEIIIANEELHKKIHPIEKLYNFFLNQQFLQILPQLLIHDITSLEDLNNRYIKKDLKKPYYHHVCYVHPNKHDNDNCLNTVFNRFEVELNKKIEDFREGKKSFILGLLVPPLQDIVETVGYSISAPFTTDYKKLKEDTLLKKQMNHTKKQYNESQLFTLQTKLLQKTNESSKQNSVLTKSFSHYLKKNYS